jgi:glycosyltransferase involved in cell wall biosynthesis
MIAYTLYDGDARIRREAETLVSSGLYDVVVLTLKNGKSDESYVVEGVRVQPLNIEKYRGKNPLRYILSYLAFTARAFLTVTRFAWAGAIDIVHVHNMPNFLIFAALVPLLQRKPVILDVHDTMPETFGATFSSPIRRIALPLLALEERICGALAGRLITVNDVQREAILARQPRAAAKMVVSMNVPDSRLFTADVAAPAKAGNGPFRVVYHGTVSRRLNVGLAVDAVARCASTIPEIQLHIVGDGDARKDLVQYCGARGLHQHIFFHDRAPFERLIPLIRGMHVGVVPLESNPATELMLPVKLMECLALGVAVVAPRLKAISHYFDERMLFFFRPGDLDSLTMALLRARDPLERRSRLRQAQAFFEDYGWNHHKGTLLDLYRQLEPSALRRRVAGAEESSSLTLQKSSKE